MRSKCACPASFFRSVESVSERIIDELWKDSPFTHTVSEWRRFGQGIGELDAISSAGCPVTLRAKWNQLLAKAKIVAKNGLTLAIPDPVPAPPISQTAWLQSGVYTSGVSPMSSFKIENLVDGTMISSGTIAYQNGDFPWQGVVVLEGDDGNGTYSYSVTGSLIFETSGRYTRGSCAAPVALKMVSTAHGVRVSLYSPNRGPVPGVNYGPYCDLPSSWITIAEPFRFKN